MWSSWDILGDSLVENLSRCTLAGAGGDSEVNGLPSAISRAGDGVGGQRCWDFRCKSPEAYLEV